MRLKGSCEIQVVDSKTGIVKQRLKQDNLIPNNTLVALLYWNTATIFSDKRISISTQTNIPTVSNHALKNIIATGYIPSGISSPTFNATANPPFGQIQNRIDFTGSQRTFNTVGLTGRSSSNIENNASDTTYAYLLLDTPCVQGAYDYLDIFYRIQFLNSEGQGLSPQAVLDYGKSLFNIDSYGFYFTPVSNFSMVFLETSVCQKPAREYPYTSLLPGDYIGCDHHPDGPIRGWTSGNRVDSHYKWKMRLNHGLDVNIGTIYNLMVQGRNKENKERFAYSQLETNGNPLQNLFSHSADATVPFFDSLKLATGNGKVYLGGNWRNKWPELYKVTITAGGATGTASYRWSVRRHLGFSGNAYTDKSVICPFRNYNKAAAPGFHGWRDENNDVLRYSPTQVCQYDDTGVTLLDLFNGSYTNWDATTTPALPVTRAQQIAVDPTGKKIYVSCRAKGLWVIDVAANSITNPITVSCYGVDVGRNGVAFALTDGALLRSVDWNTPLPFTYAGITDGNWNRVQFLRVDPENVNDQLALVTIVPNQANRIVWWSVATQTAVNGPQNANIRRWPAAFDVSDTGSCWACYGVGLPTYGSTAVAGTDRDIPKQSLTHSVWGADSYGKISFYKDLLILNSAVCNKSGVNQKTFTDLGGSSFALHMGGGIVLTNRNMRHLFSDNGTFTWDDYGWDGSQWQLEQTGGKTTHTGEEPLNAGLTIKFQDGSNAPHFVATDFYTAGVLNGVWKDNASSIQFESAYYSKPAQFGVQVQNGLTVPTSSPYEVILSAATDPAFVTIEVDSRELTNLTLNGQPVATVYLNNTAIPPGPNECIVFADGRVRFNAADSGKTISGYYAYVKN